MPRRAVWLAAALLLLAACGSDDATVEDDLGPRTIAVSASANTFDTLAEMKAASDIVIEGTVVEVREGTFRPAPATEDFAGTQSLEIVVAVERVLHGDLAEGTQVAVPWAGYEVAADGTPGPQMIVNGQPPPAVGDRDVWFLAAHGTDQMGLVAYEGRVRVADNGSLGLRAPVGSGAAAEVAAFPGVDELAAAVATAGG